MNDVLAKPFTRDGMVRILKKHLKQLLKNPPAPGSAGDETLNSAGVPGAPPAPSSYPNAALAAAQMSMQQQMANAAAAAAAAAGGQMQAPVKFESTPIPSPTTTASWHSPSTMQQHTSPTMDGGGGGGYMSAVGGSGPMGMTPGGTQRGQQYGGQGVLPQIGTPTLGRMPDIMGVSDDRPEKRQRLGYGPPQGTYQQ